MPEPNPQRHTSRFFWLACAFESALLVVALVLARLSGQPLFSDLHWSLTDLLLGLVASAPMCVLFWWMLRSSLAPLARIRSFLVRGLRPFFIDWSWLKLATVSILAGVCEEVLFRSVIQGALSALAGPPIALLIASALFGAAHMVTLAYGIIAAAIGAYLGILWLAGGNLLIPITAHAAYDFLALLYFLRLWKDESEK